MSSPCAASLKSINPGMDAEGEAYNLARALELKGISNDPEHFLRLQQMMVQAINASRGKVTASDYMAFTSRAGTGTTATLSDFFYSRVAPTLIQEMGGQTAGRALATLRRQLLGGHMQLQSAGEWLRLGLLDLNKVEYNKIGNVKRVHPGALVDSDLFSRDPYAWIQAYLKPAMQKRGIVADEKIAAEMATLFSDRYAENMATILYKQMQRIEKDAKLAGDGMGLEAEDYARTHGALAAARDLGASVETLLAAFGGPLAGPAIETMNFFADWARQIAEQFGGFAKDHPLRAMATSGALGLGLGYVGLKGLQATFGLMTGATALTGSATALDAAAASLEGAAVKLGLSATGPYSPVDLAKRRPQGGFGAYLPWLIGASGSIGALAAFIYFMSTDPANAGEGDIYTRNPDGTLRLTPYGRNLKPTENVAPEYPQNVLIDRLPRPRPRNIVEDISQAIPPAKAEISGNANVNVDVQVKPAEGFWATVKPMVSNGIDHLRINGTGSTGSTGQTMPEVGQIGPNHSVSVPH
jgi:hypothetical protein